MSLVTRGLGTYALVTRGLGGFVEFPPAWTKGFVDIADNPLWGVLDHLQSVDTLVLEVVEEFAVDAATSVLADVQTILDGAHVFVDVERLYGLAVGLSIVGRVEVSLEALPQPSTSTTGSGLVVVDYSATNTSANETAATLDPGDF